MNAPELITPYHRVSDLLQRSENGLTIQSITKEAGVTEEQAKACIESLHLQGQIETIPTPGLWGNRYAWLSTKPVEVSAEVVGDGSGEELPELPDDDDGDNWPDIFTENLPRLGKNIQGELAEELAEPNATLDADRELVASQAVPLQPSLTEQIMGYYAAHYREPTRYAVAVPKRPLRIVKSRERAESLAMSAVRNGAKDAQVFALTAIGRARRGAEWVETTA